MVWLLGVGGDGVRVVRALLMAAGRREPVARHGRRALPRSGHRGCAVVLSSSVSLVAGFPAAGRIACTLAIFNKKMAVERPGPEN